MTRALAPGFISHARLMLTQAAAIIDDEWDDPDVQMSPAQTESLRSSITECRRLITKLEPFVKAFESVSDTRKNALVAK